MRVDKIKPGDTVEWRSGSGVYDKDLGRCLIPIHERSTSTGMVTAVYPDIQKIRVGDKFGRYARTVDHGKIISHTPKP